MPKRKFSRRQEPALRQSALSARSTDGRISSPDGEIIRSEWGMGSQPLRLPQDVPCEIERTLSHRPKPDELGTARPRAHVISAFRPPPWGESCGTGVLSSPPYGPGPGAVAVTDRESSSLLPLAFAGVLWLAAAQTSHFPPSPTAGPFLLLLA